MKWGQTCIPNDARPTCLLYLKIGRRTGSIALALCLFGAGGSAEAATFQVNNVNDNGAGSLRQAINMANTNPGPDLISFTIPGPGLPPFTIAPLSALPIITETLTIDGTTQPGFTNLPIIELNGIQAGANARGFEMRAAGGTIRGLVINRFAGGAIWLESGGGGLVEHNFIGTDVTGAIALGNAANFGQIVINNSSSNVIGGLAGSSRNVISGNNMSGVEIMGPGSTMNRVQGNFIGTDLTGSAALNNPGDGVFIQNGASQNLVGGILANARNVISGNMGAGIHLAGPAPANVVQGNLIGTDVSGTAAMGNSLGILVSSLVTNSMIGGTAPGAGNVIAFNNGGITLLPTAGPGNLISANSVFANGQAGLGGLGIDLGGDGVTPNDFGDGDEGPNHLQNFPDLSKATTSSNATIINGALFSRPAGTYRLEFFNSPQCNPGGFGEGRVFLGARTIMTDASGITTFSFTLPVPVPLDSVITAITTDAANNTSEFSTCVLVQPTPSDLSVSVSVSPPYPHIGENFTYTATVLSSGDDVQTGVVLSDQLPAGVNFVSVTASQGSCSTSNGLVVCDLGDFPPGVNPTVSVTLNSSNGVDLINTTSVSSTAPDLDPSNNQVTILTTVYAPGPPVIAQQPQGGVFPPGGTVVLHVSGSPPPLLFQWRRNGVNLPGETNDTLVLANVGPLDGAGYSVVVANEFDAVTSQPAPVVVDTPALRLSDDFDNATFISDPSGLGSGNNFNATKQAGEPSHLGKTGGKSVWLNWLAPENGIVTFSTTGSTFDTIFAAYTGPLIDALTEVAADDDSGMFLNSTMSFNAVAGTVYHIVIDGFAGEEGSITLGWQLENGAPRQPEILGQPLSQVVDLGQSAQLTVSVAGQPGIAFQYQWFFNGQRLTGENQDTLVVSNVNAQTVGSYFVRVTGNSRSVDSSSALVQVSQNAGGPDAVLATSKFRDTADAVARGTGQPRNPKSRPKVVAHGFSGTQIFNTLGSTTEPGEPNHCGVIGGASYWFAYQPPTNGLVLISTEGSSYDTVLAIYTGPGDQFSTLVPVACDNNGGTNGLTSKTTFPVTGGTIYWIAVDGVGGASGTVVLNWTLFQAPKITAQPTNRVVISGSNATFNVTASGTAPLAYQWHLDGSPLLNRTNSSLVVSSALPIDGGNYTVVVTNTAGSVTSLVATLTVLIPPSVSSQPSSLIVTNGSNALFSVTAAGTAPLTYQWRFNDGNISGQTNATLTISNAAPGNEGGYTVVITNSAGLVTSAIATLTVLVPPAISAQPSSQIVTNDSNVTFNVTATGTPAPGYQWRFNGNDISGANSTSLVLPMVHYTNSGDYVVVVSNLSGSMTSSVAVLTVLLPLELRAPTGSLSGFRFTVACSSNVEFRIEASTNLINWTPLLTNSTSTGLYDFIDLSSTNFPYRFYRARHELP